MIANPTTQRGVTLIEILVSLVIISLFLLGMGALQARALQGSLDSSQRSKAGWLAYELADRMRANPEGVTGGHYLTFAGNSGLCGGTPAKVCRNYHSGTSSINAASCDAVELARFDIWELRCGFDTQGIKDDLVDFINNSDADSRLSLSCTDNDASDANPCSEGSTYNIRIAWKTTAVDAKNKTSPNQQLTLAVRP
ncbi:MAG: type IV pilus modification protein PilV [Ketobacteraceae bacterium]|nr:type IV pilus modification protein PilV [Ketobacteraceae bacterium]